MKKLTNFVFPLRVEAEVEVEKSGKTIGQVEHQFLGIHCQNNLENMLKSVNIC